MVSLLKNICKGKEHGKWRCYGRSTNRGQSIRGMHLTNRSVAGFALIACLLLLLLLSTMSVALLMMVNTETAVGANDINNNIAFHAAEGAIEKMTADLSGVFTTLQAPNCDDIINGVKAGQPPDTNLLKYVEYQPNLACKSDRTLQNNNCGEDGKSVCWGSLPDGTYAQIVPVTLAATVQSGLGDQARMIRTAQVALIPVFQFGMFSNSDVAFFNSPDLDFAGRVHTNGDLYLGVSNGDVLLFHQKLEAYGNVIRQRLPNNLQSNNSNWPDTGKVYIPVDAGNCDPYSPASPPSSTNKSCVAMAAIGSTDYGDASVVDGPNSAQNSKWGTKLFNSMLIDGNYDRGGGTGAKCLSLPFATGKQTCPSAPGEVPTVIEGAQPFEIIRRPTTAGDIPGSALYQARVANTPEIRILLADNPSENHLDSSPVDDDDIRLANVGYYEGGVPVPGLPGNTFFAEGTTDTSQINETNWTIVPTVDPGIYCSDCTAGGAPRITSNTWNLLDGYLRVEYLDETGPHGITREWLERGFARNYNPPATSSIHPKAILILQQLADRNGDGGENVGTPASILDDTQGWSGCVSTGNPYSPPAGATSCDAPVSSTSGCSGTKKKWKLTCHIPQAATPGELATDSGTSSKYAGSATRNNWYPINFYDAREGEVRDNLGSPTAGSCSVNGIVNVVELDVGNLQDWLKNTATGQKIDAVKDNGYVLYFSDRRGMQPNSAGVKTGDSGLEDTINLSKGSNAGTGSTSGTDGVLESSNDNKSPEDVNLNGKLDNYGAKNLGLGFGVNSNINPTSGSPNPYYRISCLSTGRPNWVSGARHGLRLVDGGLGKLPLPGFTVVSENPVYLLGDYNSNSSQEGTWTAHETTPPTNESASSIIADAVTILSAAWINGGDYRSMKYPFSSSTTTTPAQTTHYRVAIAAGKNRTFNSPSWSQTGTTYGYGTDGGVHNFLKFLEDWTGDQLYYKGSLVSLYYSTYATGTFKCCNNAVYHPPERHYAFDTLFEQPQYLPPRTPTFRDVNNLSYRQDITPR